LRATTVADLARRYGIELPRPAETLYQWPDFYGFLDVLRLTSLVLRNAADFQPRGPRVLSRTQGATATSATSNSSSTPTISIPTASTTRPWSTP
jgi:hypothetical protein